MKHQFPFLPVILILLITSCGPSAEEIAIQTATASTAIAASWTKTPTSTLTHTPTFTPTITPHPTNTPTITPTPFGGGSGQIACDFCLDPRILSISVVKPDGTEPIFLTDKSSSGVSFDWSRNGARLGYISFVGIGELSKAVTCVIDAYSFNEQCFELGGGSFELSPDGSKMAIGGHSQTLYLVDIDSGKSQILMEHQNVGYDWQVDWSPDGTQLAVAGIGIIVINVESGEKYVLVEGKETDYFNTPHWSPDGNKIVFAKRNNLFIINADGSDETLLVKNEGNAIWSPTGTQIAYITGNADQRNIIVMNADGTNKVKLTPSQPIYDMVWASDGNFIVYRTYYGSLYNGRFDLNAVEVNSQRLISFTKTHDVLSYTLSPDGSAIAYTLGSYDTGECFKSFVASLDGTILSEWKDISCHGKVGPWRPTSNSDGSVLPTTTQGQSWEFESDGDTEGWEAFLDLAPLQVSNGYMLTASTGNNTWMNSPIFGLDAETFSKIEVRMKSDNNSPIWLAFITSADYIILDGSKVTGFDAIGDGQFHNYVLDMSKMETWKGVVRQIRLKLLEPQTAIEIDYIRITEP